MENAPDQPSTPPSASAFESRLTSLETAINTLGTHLARLSLPTHPDPSSPPPPSSLEVPTIPVRNRRYAGVLAVDTYRLRDRASTLRPDQVANLTTAANQIRPRLDGCMFCGDPPLSVLPFLQQLVRVADQSHMTEAALLWVVDDFLRPPAQGAFRSQRFDSWPLAIHWLLVTYASETILESAVRRIQTTSQATNESVQEFGLRIQIEAAALGSLLPQAEVKSLFSHGLRDPVRSLFVAHQSPIELDDATSLSLLVSRAALLESGTRSSPSSSLRVPSRPRVLMTPEHVSHDVAPDMEFTDMLAFEAKETRAPSSHWVCFVCYTRGHGWLACPLLDHVPVSEKEEIVLRRRQYLDKIRPRPSSPRPSVVRRFDGDSTRPTPPASPKNGPASPLQ
jgi:hypothetical protein